MKAARSYPCYTVTPKAEAAILRGHPWVYDVEIVSSEGTTENGGLVDVLSKKGRYLGTGFLSEHSKIRVRLLSRNTNDRFDQGFWRRRCICMRQTISGVEIFCICGGFSLFPL